MHIYAVLEKKLCTLITGAIGALSHVMLSYSNVCTLQSHSQLMLATQCAGNEQVGPAAIRTWIASTDNSYMITAVSTVGCTVLRDIRYCSLSYIVVTVMWYTAEQQLPIYTSMIE
jgi:hypothetical protein